MNTNEKRKHPRVNALNLSYICLDEDQQVIKQGMGRTLNVSESGILLETHFPIEARAHGRPEHRFQGPPGGYQGAAGPHPIDRTGCVRDRGRVHSTWMKRRGTR